MADGNRNGANPILAFIVGALLVVAVGGGILAYTGNLPTGAGADDGPSVTLKLPDVDVDRSEEAAEEMSRRISEAMHPPGDLPEREMEEEIEGGELRLAVRGLVQLCGAGMPDKPRQICTGRAQRSQQESRGLVRLWTSQRCAISSGGPDG